MLSLKVLKIKVSSVGLTRARQTTSRHARASASILFLLALGE